VEQALRFVRESQTCNNEGHSEASWNCEVHLPLLKQSLELSVHASVVAAKLLYVTSEGRESGIDKCSSTAAAIQPSTLCPNAEAGISTTRKVDLAMVLKLPSLITDDMYQRIPFVNQTYYTPVRSTPIAVSIETKLVGTDYEPAQTQMAVWVFAQFAHLRAIFGRVPSFLPLLLVQGDDWTFMAATQAHAIVNSNLEVNGYVTTIWDKVFIGNTSSLEGVWKVSAVLQYLATWSATKYVPWFEACLDSSTSEKSLS